MTMLTKIKLTTSTSITTHQLVFRESLTYFARGGLRPSVVVAASTRRQANGHADHSAI